MLKRPKMNHSNNDSHSTYTINKGYNMYERVCVATNIALSASELGNRQDYIGVSIRCVRVSHRGACR